MRNEWLDKLQATTHLAHDGKMYTRNYSLERGEGKGMGQFWKELKLQEYITLAHVIADRCNELLDEQEQDGGTR